MIVKKWKAFRAYQHIDWDASWAAVSYSEHDKISQKWYDGSIEILCLYLKDSWKHDRNA